MKSSSVPFASLNSGYFEDYSILNYSNHVQSDNKDFSRALGSTVAICTCPPSKVCVPFSPSPQRNYFPMVFLTSLGKSIRSISCFDNILIIISFVRTNLSRAPDKASHIHMRERKEVVLASLRDKMSREFPWANCKEVLNYWSWFSITYGTYFLNSETCLILRACA